MIKMKLMCLIVMLGFSGVHANAWSQQKKIDLFTEQASIVEFLGQLERQTHLKFVFNHEDVRGYSVNGDWKGKTVAEILESAFAGKPLKYEIINDNIVISRDVARGIPQAVEAWRVSGKVTDIDGNPLPGVSVVIKGTAVGVATDADGKFSLDMIEGQNPVLVLSFIGMKTVELKVSKTQKEYKVTLEEAQQTLEDVVVTGFFAKSKNSFTGSVKSLTSEEIKAVSNTNLVSAISMLTPGLRLIENNQFGADPNRLPEIVIRGTSSMASDSDESPNQPVIMLDGVEITLRDLYDLDINDIERVDVLKDASATALYGEKAANGVIIIERKRVLNSQLRLTYNLDGTVDVPDLNTYDYLNATDKLEFERLAGLYNFDRYDDFEEYNRKRILIAKGVNTDWMSKPLRTGFAINNSIGISGKGGNMTYRVNANVKTAHGVMKEDYRNTYGLNVFLSYHIDNRLTVSFQSRFSGVKAKNSPYGSFSDYVRMNPYDEAYDEYGKVIRTLSWENINPLHEATCGNFSKNTSTTFQNSLNIRWDILKGFYVTATGSVTSINSGTEEYTAPTSAKFKDTENLPDKGSLKTGNSKELNFKGNFVLNYNQAIGENHMLSLHLGGDIEKNEKDGYDFLATGFYKKNLYKPYFAAKYAEGRTPGGKEELSAALGVFVNANYILMNRYFVDGSFRRSGSSKFGANNKYAPFWSVGCGWNIHNENFLRRDWLNTFRLRYSYGVTGNVSFSPYQAVTTYFYDKNNFYYHGIGAVPKTMGNKDLTWQATKMHDFGLNLDLIDNRFSVVFDYYVKTTDDLLIDLTIPPSVGENTVKSNLGKIRNKGFEFDVAAMIVRTNNWRFNLKLNGAHNKNKILAISNGLAAQNDKANQQQDVSPKLLYKEGQSTSAIYAVRSAGINPATGEEVFITKDGEYTLTYNADDKVVVGDLNPKLEGSVFPGLYYKNWSLNLTMSYRFGGQIYNTTRAENVENVDPRGNVDQRAFDERWKNVNDVVPYLDIANADSRLFIHTSRFVEDENTLEMKRIELGYEFNSDWLRRAGFKRLRVSVGANDVFRISTVKYERGTQYPFSRGFSFSISPTF